MNAKDFAALVVVAMGDQASEWVVYPEKTVPGAVLSISVGDAGGMQSAIPVDVYQDEDGFYDVCDEQPSPDRSATLEHLAAQIGAEYDDGDEY